MSSTLADAIRFAGPKLALLAEHVICDLESDAPDRPESRRRSASDGLH
jgi:hypothetical protein